MRAGGKAGSNFILLAITYCRNRVTRDCPLQFKFENGGRVGLGLTRGRKGDLYLVSRMRGNQHVTRDARPKEQERSEGTLRAGLDPHHSPIHST